MRQIHKVTPKGPLAVAIDGLIRLQVQVAILSELAERLSNQELFDLSVRMFDDAETAISKAKGRH